MMHLRGLVLFLLFLPSVARRSIRIDDSLHNAQQQNTAQEEALIPRASGTGASRRAGPRHAAPWFHSGPHRAKVALQATGAPEEGQLPPNEAEGAEAVTLAPCPPTEWGTPVDVQAAQRDAKPPSVFPAEVRRPDSVRGASAELQWFEQNAASLLQQRTEYGAVVLRGFELTSEPDGFQRFYQTIGLRPCADPLASVSAREVVSQKGGVYEAVNKPSRSNYFVGLHNEMVGVRTPRSAVFVCFKAAEEGGEFLLVDGRRMLKELDPSFLQKLYTKQIRYAVAEFPLGFLDALPQPLTEAALPVVQGLLKFLLKFKVDFPLDTVWSTSDYDGQRVLQARAAAQPPVVRHPETGEPVWFCNVHGNSAVLRARRAEEFGEERFVSGASRINKSDMFFGDGEPLSDEELNHVDEVTRRNIQSVKMEKGDVVMLDNYMVMHGRNVFSGTRKHAVTWMEN